MERALRYKITASKDGKNGRLLYQSDATMQYGFAGKLNPPSSAKRASADACRSGVHEDNVKEHAIQVLPETDIAVPQIYERSAPEKLCQPAISRIKALQR